jgi:hypothetical protein
VALIGFLVAQVGFPMTVRPASGKIVRPCGCEVSDESETCCCSAEQASAPAATSCQPPQPETTACPECQAQQANPRDECPLCREQPEPKPAELKRDSQTRVTWVIGSLLQRCHGVQTSWITLGAVLPPADHVRIPSDRLLSERIPISSVVALPISVPPNDPPPRLLSI